MWICPATLTSLAITNIDGVARTAAQNGQAFANALREYWIANGQVPTFYLSIYGAPEL